MVLYMIFTINTIRGDLPIKPYAVASVTSFRTTYLVSFSLCMYVHSMAVYCLFIVWFMQIGALFKNKVLPNLNINILKYFHMTVLPYCMVLAIVYVC